MVSITEMYRSSGDYRWGGTEAMRGGVGSVGDTRTGVSARVTGVCQYPCVSYPTEAVYPVFYNSKLVCWWTVIWFSSGLKMLENVAEVWIGWGQSPREWDQLPYKSTLAPLPREHSENTEQEAGSHQLPGLLVSSASKTGKKHFCCLEAPQFIVFLLQPEGTKVDSFKSVQRVN